MNLVILCIIFLLQLSETRGIVFFLVRQSVCLARRSCIVLLVQYIKLIILHERRARQTDCRTRKKTIPRVSDNCKRNIIHKIHLFKVKNHRFLGHLWWRRQVLRSASLLLCSCHALLQYFFQASNDNAKLC